MSDDFFQHVWWFAQSYQMYCPKIKDTFCEHCTVAKSYIRIEPTKDTPYLTLMGEPWSAFCEDFEEN